MKPILVQFQSAAVRRSLGASPLLTLAASLIWLLPNASQWFEYQRTAIAAGELWRILTCHLTHWSFDQLFWDAAALVVLGILCEAENRGRFLACLAGSAVLIPLAVWICFPEIPTYRGLSGIDSALFVLLAAQIIHGGILNRQWRWVVVTGIVATCFVAKILFEIVTRSTVFVDSAAADMVPIPLVHVVGAVVGLVTALVPRLRLGWWGVRLAKAA